MSAIKKCTKPFCLFVIGGTMYIGVEVAWRALRCSHPTHWTMFVVGGVAFLLVGAVNEYLPWDTPLWKQMLVGDVAILADEFTFGCILNKWLKLGIWDYSNLPFNILGQVCLPFAAAWLVLAAAGIVLDDYLRYWLFGEEKPRYRLI